MCRRSDDGAADTLVRRIEVIAIAYSQEPTRIFHSPTPFPVTPDLAPLRKIDSSMLDHQKLAPNLSESEFDCLANSQLIKILRANPWLSRFYEGYFQLYPDNSRETNNLEDRSENFSDLNPKGPNPMPRSKNPRSCTHIKVNGIRCGSPALCGEHFCYFHQRMIRGVRTPSKSRLHPMALIEDEEAIQASLMEVVNALVRNHIDLKRAQLILRALHIAVKNAPRVRFASLQSQMVREIPDYPAAPAPPKPAEPPVTPEMVRANQAAVAYLKSVEQKAAEAKAAARKKAAAEQLAEAAKLFEPSKPELPQKVTSAAHADPAIRKSPSHAAVATPTRKSAYSRSG